MKPVASFFFVLAFATTLTACGGDEPLLPAAAPAPEGQDEDADRESETGDTGDEEIAPAANSDGVRSGAPSEVRDAEAMVLEDLRGRREAWHKRQLEVAERDAALDALEGELSTRMNTISDLERRLSTQLGIGKQAQERRDERVGSLADLIATMPPQAGAEIVAQMSDKDAQWLLLAIARKSDRKAAKLMALMPPDRAAALGQLYIDTDPDSVVQKGELGQDPSANLPAPPAATPTPPPNTPPPASAAAPSDATTTPPSSQPDQEAKP